MTGFPRSTEKCTCYTEVPRYFELYIKKKRSLYIVCSSSENVTLHDQIVIAKLFKKFNI